MKNKTKALIYVFSCILLWSFIPVVSKIGQINLDNYQFLFWSSFLSFLVLFFSSVIAGKSKNLIGYSIKEIIAIAGLGFLGTFLYYILLYFGYAHAKGLEVLVLQYSWPIFIVIFSVIFLKEKITTRNIIAMLLGFVGALIVLTKGHLAQVSLDNYMVDFIVILAAMSFGLFSVLSKKVKFEPFSYTTYLFLTATILSFIAMIVFSKFAIPSKQSLIPILVNGILINGFSYVLWLKGLSYAKASFIAPFIFITPILATILIIVFFHETFLVVYFIGLLLIILSGLFNK